MKTLKWIVKLSCLMPFAYLLYMSFFGDLGAEPIVKINTLTGYFALCLVLINLLLGVMIALYKKWPKFVRPFFAERRYLGIASGVYAILHFVSYLGKEGFQTKGLEQIVTKFYLGMGMLALVFIMILTLTSNDLSVKFLKMKNWKRLHRLVYLALVFMAIHVFSIEKANLLLLGLLIIPIVILQAVRFALSFKKT